MRGQLADDFAAAQHRDAATFGRFQQSHFIHQAILGNAGVLPRYGGQGSREDDFFGVAHALGNFGECAKGSVCCPEVNKAFVGFSAEKQG